MGDSLEILAEVLDKLIETQVQNAQIISELKNAVADTNLALRDVDKLLTEINSHFSNGFRQEFRSAITDAAIRVEKNINIKANESHEEALKLYTALTEFTTALKSPKTWIQACLFVGSVFGLIAGVVTVLHRVMGGP